MAKANSDPGSERYSQLEHGGESTRQEKRAPDVSLGDEDILGKSSEAVRGSGREQRRSKSPKYSHSKPPRVSSGPPKHPYSDSLQSGSKPHKMKCINPNSSLHYHSMDKHDRSSNAKKIEAKMMPRKSIEDRPSKKVTNSKNIKRVDRGYAKGDSAVRLRDHEKSHPAKGVRCLKRCTNNSSSRSDDEFPGSGSEQFSLKRGEMIDNSRDFAGKMRDIRANLPEHLAIKWYGKAEFVDCYAEELRSLHEGAKKLTSEEMDINALIASVKFEISNLDRDIEISINEQKILSNRLKEIDSGMPSAT